MMIHYLYELKEQNGYAEFIEAANRISRIGEKELGTNVDSNKFTEDEEKTLYAKFQDLEKELQKLKDQEPKKKSRKIKIE